jgi:hypothetical protein
MEIRVAERQIDIAGAIDESVAFAAVAAARRPAAAVLGQECCSRRLHLGRQQVIPLVPKVRRLVFEKGHSLVFAECSWTELAAGVERFRLGKMAVEKHTCWMHLKPASCLFSEVVLAAAAVDIDYSSLVGALL